MPRTINKSESGCCYCYYSFCCIVAFRSHSDKIFDCFICRQNLNYSKTKPKKKKQINSTRSNVYRSIDGSVSMSMSHDLSICMLIVRCSACNMHHKHIVKFCLFVFYDVVLVQMQNALRPMRLRVSPIYIQNFKLLCPLKLVCRCTNSLWKNDCTKFLYGDTRLTNILRINR